MIPFYFLLNIIILQLHIVLMFKPFFLRLCEADEADRFDIHNLDSADETPKIIIT